MQLEQLEGLLLGAHSLRLPSYSAPQDLRTSQTLSLLSELRVSALPVGVRPHPDCPLLAPLLLAYSLSPRFMQTVLSPGRWKQRAGDWEGLALVMGLLVWGNRRMVELEGSRLARLHFPKENWEELNGALAAGLQANLGEGGGGFVAVLSQLPVHTPFYQSFKPSLNTLPDLLLLSLQPAAIPPLSFDISQVLACNQSLLQPIHAKETHFLQELQSVETQLQQYHSHQGGTSIHSVLQSALNLAASSGEVETYAGLAALQAQFTTTQFQLESRVGVIKEEIQGLYLNSGLEPHLYGLHGLIVLYLPSNSYHCYMKKGSSWFKFTDTDVSEVAWTEIASCVHCPTVTLQCALYSPGSPALPLSFPIPDFIESQNKRFERDLQDYKDTETVLHINELYSARITLLSALHHKYRAASLSSPHTAIRYEVMNFPYYLKLKADDNLSKWVVLDECLREVDGLGRGLCDFDERNGFILKLKSQLLTAWRDVPRFIFISLHEKLQLERLLETFFTSYRELQLSLYVLSHMNQGEYEASLCALRLVLIPLPAEPSNFLKILRDACKVLALRLLSLMYALRPRERGSVVRCLTVLRSLFIDPNDIHSKQIQTSIEALSHRDGDMDLMDLSADLKDYSSPHPADLTALLREIASTDVYSWLDLNPVSQQFSEEMRKMKEEALAPWVRLHLKLTTSKLLLPALELENCAN